VFDTNTIRAYNEDGDRVTIDPDHVSYWSCQCCSDEFLDECDHNDTVDGMVCNGCYDSYVNCESCNDTIHDDNASWDEENDCYYCDHCNSNRRRVIDGYHSRNNQSKRDSWQLPHYRHSLLFGVELELLANNDDDALRHVSNCAKSRDWLAERDGSLHSERGIEIIAPPMSFEDNKTNWVSFLDDIRGTAKGWNAGTGYGMHVSFSRRTLRDLHCGKLLMFVHKHQTLCENVAGRSANEWCRFREKKIGNGAWKGNISNKYEALAMRGDDRWEMRIFRSTTSNAGFLRNLEFVKACIDFTRQASALASGHHFQQWLMLPQNRSQYPNLFKHLFPSYAATAEMRLNIHKAKQANAVKI
jgi:hypothetical protein